MSEATVIVRVDGDLKAAFTEAAKAADRTTSQLLRDFMRDYVRRQAEEAGYDSWFRAKVAAGRAAAARGDVVDGADVEAEFARRRETSVRRANEIGR
jgi:predicted transcriptional regulator